MLIQSHDSMIGKFEGENKIMRETIALMQLQIQTLISTIPALQGNPSSRVFFEYVLVIDAREERLPIPLQTITSKEVSKTLTPAPIH